jgi:methylglutamate dehydrogenase subunit D
VADAPHFPYGPGRLGRGEGAPGLVLQELSGFALASVIARKDQAVQAAEAALRAFGALPPSRPAVAAGSEFAFVWSGPGHWLALGPQATAAVETRLVAVFGTHASVFDQSGSRVLLDIRGPRARDVLAKGVSIDLHPRAFKTGDAAVTTASHLAVHLWQMADEPAYRLLVVRTYFDSLWRWLAASAAEYGCEVQASTTYTSHAT